MRLNIGALVGNKGDFLEVEKEISADFIESLPDVNHVDGPLVMNLLVTNTGEGYLVNGHLNCEVVLRCSRCLKPMETKLKIPIEEEFLNRRPEGYNEESFLDEIPVAEGNELNLKSLIEESVLMNIPMKPVCESDCLGLCSICGTNLSDGQCDCDTTDVDIRLAPLKKLLETATKSPERRKDHGSTKEKTLKSKN